MRQHWRACSTGCKPCSRLDLGTGALSARAVGAVATRVRVAHGGARTADDVCAIVTAASRLIAEPFARLFGVEHLLATNAATADGSPDGVLTGEIDSLLCWREHKVAHVAAWLAERQPRLPSRLGDFERSWFYADSASDLPLLEAVSVPMAVRPDSGLRAHARCAGWAVIN